MPRRECHTRRSRLGDDQEAVQDQQGNDAASFTDMVIKNSFRVLPAPTNLRATGIDDTRIGLAWNAPDLSGLVVYY